MPELHWYGNRVFTLATEANIKAMEKAANLVVKDVKTHFTGVDVAGEKARRAAGGKVQSGGKSPPSKPGQPPAVQTGILRASIMSEVKQSGIEVIGKVGPDIEHIAAKAPVGTNVEYGYFLETGTSKMEARPFLRPALHRTRKDVVKIFRDANK